MKTNDWIRVADKLPEIMVQVLVAYHDYQGHKHYSTGNLALMDYEYCFDIHNAGETMSLEFIDYWMPIVEPKEEEKMKNLTFGAAIEALKQGKKVTRMGWNGKGMYLWLKPATTIKAEWCKDPMLKEIVDTNGGEAEALGTICMKTADNKILTGWLASQTDMLSEDWMIIE